MRLKGPKLSSSRHVGPIQALTYVVHESMTAFKQHRTKHAASREVMIHYRPKNFHRINRLPSSHAWRNRPAHSFRKRTLYDQRRALNDDTRSWNRNLKDNPLLPVFKTQPGLERCQCTHLAVRPGQTAHSWPNMCLKSSPNYFSSPY